MWLEEQWLEAQIDWLENMQGDLTQTWHYTIHRVATKFELQLSSLTLFNLVRRTN